MTTNFLPTIPLVEFGIFDHNAGVDYGAVIFFAKADGTILNGEGTEPALNNNHALAAEIKAGTFDPKTDVYAFPRGNDSAPMFVFCITEKAEIGALAKRIVDYLNKHKLNKPRIVLANMDESQEYTLQQLVYEIQMNSYEFTLKTKQKPKTLTTVWFDIPDDIRESSNCEAIISKASNAAFGSQYMRKLGQMPPNMLGTEELLGAAIEIEAICPSVKVSFKYITKENDHGMGLMYAVGKGSPQPTIMIEMRYIGDESAPLTALVGKGLVYDTGGTGLKPASNGMKYDMLGSGAVLGTFLAAAKNNAPVNIVGAICAIRNDIGPNAMVADDVYYAFDGQSVEITHTDAEGRLGLADLLAYIDKTYNPAETISLATLTGAALIASGERAPIFSKDDDFLSAMEYAAEIAGEKVLSFEMDPALEKSLESKIADWQNADTKDRTCGHTKAAMFLNMFINSTYLHIDIAGACKEKGYFGVPTLLAYLMYRRNM